MSKLKVKTGDTVVITTGKDAGKKGKIIKAIPTEGKVVVEGVNIKAKHQKPRSQQDPGGIVKKEMPMQVSNVMLVCEACKKPTRVAYKIEGEKKTRMCKKCGKPTNK